MYPPVVYSASKGKANSTNLLLVVKPCANEGNFVGQHLPTLLNVTFCVCLHILLHVVVCHWELLCKVWANNSQHFFCSVITKAQHHNLVSICTAFAALLCLPHMRVTDGLQSLMGCIFPMMHCRFQHCCSALPKLTHQCWKLLRPLSHSLTM